MVRFVDQPGGEAVSFAATDRMLKEPDAGATQWYDYERLVDALDARRAVGCHLTEAGGAQAITTATWTAITFDTETFDHGACHDTGSNTERITIPAGEKGVYIVGGVVCFAAGSTGNRLGRIAVNGAVYHYSNPEYSPHATALTRIGLSTLILLDAADYVTLDCYHTKGSDLNTDITNLEFWAYQFTKIP